MLHSHDDSFMSDPSVTLGMLKSRKKQTMTTDPGFRSKKDIEEYLAGVMALCSPPSNGIPLSAGEVERLRQQDALKRRRLRLLQVREQERLLAINRRQRYEDALKRKRDRELRKKKDQWDSEKRTELEILNRQYKSSLASIGQGHQGAVDASNLRAIEMARENILRQRDEAKQYERHEEALERELADRNAQPFFVAKKQGEVRNTVRQDMSDAQREKARRLASLRRSQEEIARIQKQRDEMEKRQFDMTHDTQIDMTTVVEQHAPAIKDFTKTRFHAMVTKHAQAMPKPDGSGVMPIKVNAFDAAKKQSEEMMQRRLEKENLEKVHNEKAEERGRIAMNQVLMGKEQEKLEEELAALQHAENTTRQRKLAAKLAAIRKSQQTRSELDQRKRKLQEQFEKTFLKPKQQEKQQVQKKLPEIMEIEEEVHTKTASARAKTGDKPPKQQPAKTKTEETQSFKDSDVQQVAEGPISIPSVHPLSPSLQKEETLEDKEDWQMPLLSPPRFSKTDEENIDVEKTKPMSPYMDEETRKLLDESRTARQQANERVRQILSVGRAHLEENQSDESHKEKGDASLSSSSASSDLSMRAQAAAAAAAVARAASEAVALDAEVQGSMFPSREQLEQSISAFLAEDEENEDDEEFNVGEEDDLSGILDKSDLDRFQAPWEPRGAPSSADGVNQLARSLLNELNDETSETSSFSEASSLAPRPLSPSSSVSQLIVEDEGWKKSGAFVSWLKDVDNFFAAKGTNEQDHEEDQDEEEEEEEIVMQQQTKTKPREEEVKHQQDELIIDDEYWKSDQVFTKFVADVEKHLEQQPPTPRKEQDEEEQHSGDDELERLTNEVEALLVPSPKVQDKETELGHLARRVGDFLGKNDNGSSDSSDSSFSATMGTPMLQHHFRDVERRLQSVAKATKTTSSNEDYGTTSTNDLDASLLVLEESHSMGSSLTEEFNFGRHQEHSEESDKSKSMSSHSSSLSSLDDIRRALQSAREELRQTAAKYEEEDSNVHIDEEMAEFTMDLLQKQQKMAREDLNEEQQQDHPGGIQFTVNFQDVVEEALPKKKKADRDLAFEVPLAKEDPDEKQKEKSQRFAERSARRAEQAKLKALEKKSEQQKWSHIVVTHEKKTPTKTKTNEKAGETPPPPSSSISASALSSGTKRSINSKEQRARTQRLYEKLPEVMLQKQEKEKERLAAERRKKVLEMENQRREKLLKQ